MEQVVKQELHPDDQLQQESPQQQDPMQQGEASTPSSAKEGCGVTLALPRPTSSTEQGKARKLDMVLKIKMKKGASESEAQQAASDQSQKTPSKKLKSGDGSSLTPETKSAAMTRAEELRSNLDPKFPSLIKHLVRSHVGSCFWMGLPGAFGRAHLPNRDTIVTLEDECGRLFAVKYIAHKTGLSAGWRIFCITNNLLEGDVLIFQLIEHCKFKIYIVKADNLQEVDGALGLLNLDAPPKRVLEEQMEAVTVTEKQITRPAKRKRGRSLPAAINQKKKRNSIQRLSIPQPRFQAERDENDSEGVASEVLEGLKPLLPDIHFGTVKSFEDFHILIDEIVLDMEFPDDVRTSYYRLCCSQASFLHQKLVKGISRKLIVGAIFEIVRIADAIQACKIMTTQDEYENWERTLKALEVLGMNVGFLCERLKRLASLAFGTGLSPEAKKYIEAKRRRASAEDEIRNLRDKLSELKEEGDKIEAEIEGLKPKVEDFEAKFHEVVSAPW
ncbi:hypothetical protein MLD38_028589 [Melastoma candidum]|uniref:Uncharacterized protein n=1 Tax=Melastoma candidum TaxID=119954 RepID=A0ACB9N3U5_9MYRT|nr:hypothetical protein MLD38_028589 [Melastoma candidum]